ncbi:MAG: PEP-CTERM sorting domain-containing protein [Gemmataceae bacterium]
MLTLLSKRTFFCMALGAMLVLAGQEARAGIIDLTTAGSSGFDAGNIGFFQQMTQQPTGSGVIQSFVRVNPGGSPNQTFERGYNTTGRPLQFDENTSATFTHDLLLSDIPTVTGQSGIVYRVFLLDINQTNSSPLLNLNEIQIFQTNTASLLGATGVDASGVGPLSFGSNATLIYDLQGIPRSSTLETILMDYSLNSGSGSGDIYAYIPDSLFDASKQYVTLYSQFGTPPGPALANDGYEEWAVVNGSPTQPPPPPPPPPPPLISGVPEPASVILLSLGGLFGLGSLSLKRRRQRIAVA